ncbi:hypothetical protein LCGC14_1321410, partial [marine sediment metagenome]
AIQTIHQAISKVTSALADSVREAMSLEIALAEIQTIAKPLRGDFEGVAVSVRELSDEFGISRDIVAEGVYQTLSNQIRQGADAFDFFKDAADLSIGAVMSADAAVNLLSSTINSFGFAADQAATISGKLFKTIELGRLRGEEFANTIGRVYVLAAQLGVGLDEANASLATFTISGLKYNEAATLTTNIMLKLIRPTDTLKELMEDMGVATAEAGIQAFGFQGFLQLLRDEAGGTAEALGLVFGRVRAIRGVMGLTNEATEKYQKTLMALREAGFEDILGAKELIFETNAKQVEIELNALKNTIVFDFGRDALAAINEVFKAFGGAVNIVKGLTVAVGILAAGAAVLAAIFFPWVAMFAAIAATVGLVTAAYNKLYTTASTKLERLVKEQEKARDLAKKAASDLVELEILGMDKIYARFQRWLIQRKKGSKDIVEDAIAKEKFLSGILFQQLDDRASAWDTFVGAIEDKIADSADTIEDSQKKIFDIQREIAGFDFEMSIKGKDARKQSFAQLDRSSKLLRDAGDAFHEGRTGMAADLLGAAKSMAKMAMSSADAAENASLEHKAQDQMRAVLKAQLNQREQIRKQAQTQAREATGFYSIEKSRADRIKMWLDKLGEIQIAGPDGLQIGTPEEAKALAAPILKALQLEFEQAKLGKSLVDRIGIQKEFQTAIGSFENLFTREPVSLKFTVDQYIDVVFAGMTAHSLKNPIPLKFIELGKELGVDLETEKGRAEAPQFLADQSKDVKRLKHELIDLKGATQAYADTLGNMEQASFNAAEQALAERTALEGLLKFRETSPVGRAQIRGERLESIKEQLEAIKTTVPNALEALENLKRGAEVIDVDEIKNVNTQLEIHINKLRAVGQIDLATSLETYVKEAKKLSELAPLRLQADAIEKDIKAHEANLKALNEVMGQGLSDSAAVGAQGVNNASTAMIESANNTRDAWREAGLAMAAASGGTPVLAHFGKMIYRASGGDARGTDTIPAMLSPGEFVMNAQSTKRFYSQLVAMNSGKSPVYRESGGSVTNVGDVNITVSGATAPKQTARETMKAFRREMRRHTSTF